MITSYGLSWSLSKMTDKEHEQLLSKIRFDRQMQKKRLYEQAKRARKQEKPSNDSK